MKNEPENNPSRGNGSMYPELKGLLPSEEETPLKSPVQPVVAPGLDAEKIEDASAYDSPTWRGPFFQVVGASCASLSAVSIGFTTGYSSLVLPQLSNSSLDYRADQHAEWVASLPSITSIAGSLVGAILMDKLGPRTTLLATAVPCILSWFFVSFCSSVSIMLLGRGLTGVFLGIYSPVPQVYATEIAEPKYRGLLGAFPEAAVALGSMLCYVLGDMMTWRQLAVTAALLPGIPLFLSMIKLPESQQWLTKQGKLAQAKKSVAYFRGPGFNADAEVARIRENIVSKHGAEISIWEQVKLFRLPQNWKPILVVFSIFMCGQFSGFAVVVNYTVTIFDAANTGIDSNTSTIIVGTVRFLSTLVSAVLLDRVGRRPLLIVSALGSSLGMISIGIFFYLKEAHDAAENIGWLPLASLLLYVFFNELGYGPIPWLLSGELIPLAVRTLGNGVAVTAYSLFAFLISVTFPSILKYFSSYTAFWLYALFSLTGVGIGWKLPETKGKTLEEIETYFMPRNKRDDAPQANV